MGIRSTGKRWRWPGWEALGIRSARILRSTRSRLRGIDRPIPSEPRRLFGKTRALLLEPSWLFGKTRALLLEPSWLFGKTRALLLEPSWLFGKTRASLLEPRNLHAALATVPQRSTVPHAMNRPNRLACATLFALLCAPRRSGAQEPVPIQRELRAIRLPHGSVQADGDASDPGWRGARRYGGFVQELPHAGMPATEATRVAVGYDDEALYVLLEAEDSKPETIRALLTRRDEDSSSDWVHVWLDTFDDDRTAYLFSVNPRGVKQDSRIFEGGSEDRSWDGVWQAGTRIGKQGWVAEIRIPLNQLRYDPEATRWGLQIGRTVQRTKEESRFNPVPRASTRPVQHFGALTRLQGLAHPLRLEVIPYLSGGLRWNDGRRSWQWGAGGDIRAGLGPSMTLDLTINPDFGQVEADPSQLNLTSYEVFFPEKRPFFLQGAEIFRFQLGYEGAAPNDTLFYSRRVGRVPSIDLGLPADQIVDSPQQTTIYGAAKLPGKTTDGWSIGVMNALTGTERARVRRGDTQVDRLVEPPANATVARISKEFGDGHTIVGAMATNLRRMLDAEGRAALPEDATTAGFDAEHRMGDFTVLGKIYGSYLHGSPEAIEALQRSRVHYFQRPDAKHLGVNGSQTSMSGWGLTYVAGKMSGQPWRGGTGVMLRSPGLDPNDLGFLRRADDQTTWGWLQYRREDPHDLYQRIVVNADFWASKTFGAERTDTGAEVYGTWTLPSYHALYAGIWRGAQVLDVSVLRGGPALIVPGRTGAWLGGATDDRKNWGVEFDTWGSHAQENSHDDVGAEVRLKARPTPSVQVNLAPGFEHLNLGHQFVDLLDDGDVIVGRLNRSTAYITLRASWALTPRLTLQGYLMPYFSAGTYANFFRVASPRASSYADRFQETAYDGSRTFLFQQVRSNLVLRWEYLDGSTLFAVWSRDQGLERGDVGVLSARRDLDSLLHSPSKDVVMLKLAHWFSM